MTTKHISCVDTAKIVRQILKESFPGVKFRVRSDSYAHGASIQVDWDGGPNWRQVESITDKLEGAYFDGLIDYQGSIYHMMDGELVTFGADYIQICNRSEHPGMESLPSKTAGRIFITHDDGYSRAVGSGIDAVAERT
jgi:hypothetical protein